MVGSARLERHYLLVMAAQVEGGGWNMGWRPKREHLDWTGQE
jgi:hypothetical protein